MEANTISSNIDPAVQEAAQDVGSAAPQIAKDVESKNILGTVTDFEGLASKLGPIVPTVFKEAKAGLKTTEFWLVIAYEALTQTGAFPVPGSTGKLIAGAAGVVAYVLSRGWAKSGVPNEETL